MKPCANQLRRIAQTLLIASIFFVGATGAFAATSQSNASRQSRDKMAAAHEKFAACLRSDRPMSECQHDMMRDCPMISSSSEGQMCGMMMQMQMPGMNGSDQKAVPGQSDSAFRK